MSTRARILLIEDDIHAAGALRDVLTGEGYEVTLAARGDLGLQIACETVHDAVISDLRLPGLNGLELVRKLRMQRPRLPVILMTAHGTTETAIEATKLGAYDYLLKPFEMEEMLELAARAVDAGRLMSVPIALGEPLTREQAIIGRSRAMQRIFKEIGRVAATPVTVLIRGETGTGKELIARAIYQHSDRAGEPFIAVNCAAIPETLLESELFGHERGAFTGAHSQRIGRFEQAHRGSIFLDEIGDMTVATQAKLLRVLQEKTIHRLGGTAPIPIDARVIAATHRDLEAAIAAREFREDLFYRINVVTIALPSLRERREDIPALAEYFLRRHAAELGAAAQSIQPEALALLERQPWPGNVRELENAVRKAALLARGYTITIAEVEHALEKQHARVGAMEEPLSRTIAKILEAAERGELENAHATFFEIAERELFGQAMTLARGNKTKAARWLGIARPTLREKLAALGIEGDTDSRSEVR